MILSFEKKYTTTQMMFDENGYMHLHSILELMQEIASTHAGELGIGRDYLKEHNYAWLLVKTKVDLKKDIKVGEDLILKTYPYQVSRVESNREYIIMNEAKEVLATCVSVWVLFDMENQKMLSSIDAFPENDNKSIAIYNERLKKIKDASINDDNYVGKVVPSYLEIDTNHHVNNAMYMKMLSGLLRESSKNVKSFGIQYVNQSYENDIINIYKEKDLLDNDLTFYTGYYDSEENKKIFNVYLSKGEK